MLKWFRRRARPVRTLGELVQQWTDDRKALAHNTHRLSVLAASYAVELFDPRLRLADFKRADATTYRRHVAQGRAPTTVACYCAQMSIMFGTALADDLIPYNPFDKTKTRADPPPRDWHYLKRSDLDRLLAVVPRDRDRCFLGLLRLAGLRLGEALALRWSDITLTGTPRLHVRSVKTKKVRDVPVEPELLEVLLRGSHGTEPDQHVTGQRWPGNARRAMLRWVDAAKGLEPWPRLFHTLRKNCETDWANNGYPQHAVSYWIGHDIKVSQEYYLQVPAELYQQMAAGPT